MVSSTTWGKTGFGTVSHKPPSDLALLQHIFTVCEFIQICIQQIFDMCVLFFCKTSVTFEHLEHLKHRPTRVLVPQIITCRQHSETWCLVVILGNCKKNQQKPPTKQKNLQTNKKPPTRTTTKKHRKKPPLSLLVFKVFFPHKIFFLSIVSYELVKVGNCSAVRAAFGADLGSCQPTGKWTRTSATGQLYRRISGWGIVSLLTLQSLILKQFWTLLTFLMST